VKKAGLIMSYTIVSDFEPLTPAVIQGFRELGITLIAGTLGVPIKNPDAALFKILELD
jgi:hypothetical protein